MVELFIKDDVCTWSGYARNKPLIAQRFGPLYHVVGIEALFSPLGGENAQHI